MLPVAHQKRITASSHSICVLVANTAHSRFCTPPRQILIQSCVNGDGSAQVHVAVVLCAEDAVAQACGIEMPGTAPPPAAAATPTIVNDGNDGSSSSNADKIAAASCQRAHLQRLPPGGVMGVMPPKIAAFWKFVDGK